MVKPYYSADGITIYHGDSREVIPALPRMSLDLLLTDPPYGISYASGRGSMGGIVGDNGTLDVVATIKLALQRLRHLRHFYVFGPYNGADLTVGSTTELIWDKGKMGSGNLSLPWGPSHERILFGVWTPSPSEKNSGALAARMRRGSVIRVPKQNNGRGAQTHPTEKPVLLMRHLIEASSVIGETVFDPFVGVGSTLVAARIEDRHAIGIEIDERYCEIAARRLEEQSLAAA